MSAGNNAVADHGPMHSVHECGEVWEPQAQCCAVEETQSEGAQATCELDCMLLKTLCMCTMLCKGGCDLAGRFTIILSLYHYQHADSH